MRAARGDDGPMGSRSRRSDLRVSTAVLAQLLRYLDHLGIDAGEVIRSAGVSEDAARSPDGQLGIPDYIAIENAAVKASGDPCFGLHMGEFCEAGNYSILGYLMMNSATLGEALAKAGKYYRILGNLIEPGYQLGLKRIKVILSAPANAPEFSRHCFEAAIATQVTMMRKITGRDLRPCEVGFVHPAPAEAGEYQRVFGCPVNFGQKHNYLTLENAWGRIPILQPSPELLGYFERYAQDLLRRLDEGRTVSREAATAIAARLSSGKARVGDVAKSLAMGTRTLQARLNEEGTDFRRLLDRTRAEWAARLVEDGSTVEDITCLLGYSEPSALRKAFKKWHGMTPKEYRELRGKSPSPRI